MLEPPVFIEDFGKHGIITDTSPFSLPPGAWSNGANVRFVGSHMERAPVYRIFQSGMSPALPVRMAAFTAPNGDHHTLLVGDDGRLFTYSDGVETERTPLGFTPIQSSRLPTTVQLSGVMYYTRKDGPLYWWEPNQPVFQTMDSWDDTWRAGVVRAYMDYLIVMDLQKGSTDYPHMVKWSDRVFFGSPPASWDADDTTTLAGENILSSLDSGLLDGMGLRDAFVLYSRNQVWLMQYIGGTLIFQFRPLFTDGGALATGCVTEYNGLHYVFGPEDLYVHDGNTKRSLATGRVRDRVFSGLIAERERECFVAVDHIRGDVWFCYPASDVDAAFSGSYGCNRAAVYTIGADAWTFYDLPNITGSARAATDQSETYDTIDPSLTYDTIGGTYDSLGQKTAVHPLVVGDAGRGSGPRIWALDRATKAPALALQLDSEATAPAWAERSGIDLTSFGRSLRDYKVATGLLPQFRSWDASFRVEVGRQNVPGEPVTWLGALPFDPAIAYRMDAVVDGRYFALKASTTNIADFEFSAVEIDVQTIGRL